MSTPCRGPARPRSVEGRTANPPPNGSCYEEDDMGVLDDAKDAAEATGKKVGEWADDTKERISDKVDEVKADADVKAAEAHRDSVEKKNEYKEDLRQS